MRLTLVMTVPILAVILRWLHTEFENVPIQWSENSLGDGCRFLSARTKNALADAGRLPLVTLSLCLLAAAAGIAAALRPRVGPRDRNVTTGALIASAALSVGTSWVAYAGGGFLLGLVFLGLTLVAVVTNAVLLLTIGDSPPQRRALRGAWVFSVLQLLLIPWLVATSSTTNETIACMG